MSAHEYFNHKHTEWSITGLLNEFKEEPFRVKIGLYLKSLETINGNERGKRQEMARFFLDKYRRVSRKTLFIECRLSRLHGLEPSCVHYNY
jgi:hypothetical protein